MSVILVGDHGQLPPVKDVRAYSWSDVRYTDRRQTIYGTKKLDAPHWGSRGLEAYDSIHDIFFS